MESVEEKKLSSMGEEDCLGNGKVPITQSTSIDSSCKETENRINSKNSWFSEVETNSIERDRGTLVYDSGNNGSNSPTYNHPYSVHTCPKSNGNVPPNGETDKVGDEPESSSIINELDSYSVHTCPNGNVPPNGQAVKLVDKTEPSSISNELETSDPNCDVGLNGKAVKLREKADRDDISLSIANELECGATSDMKNVDETTPVETDLVLNSSIKNNQPSLNLFSDLDSSSSDSKIPSLILKRWEDSPSENLWCNLKPCLVVLQRCDVNENSVYAKSLNCNTSTEQLDTISVISDTEEKPVNYSGSKLTLGKLRSRKSHSESSQYREKERSSKCLLAAIKGTSKMRKNNSKILQNMRDVSLDSDSNNDEPKSNLKNGCKNTFKVSAQIHKPPESDDDTGAITLKTSNKTSSENDKTERDITVEIQSNASTPIDQEKNNKRKRNSSSISSMSFSELYSDSEYVGSKRRIIKPSTCLQPSLQMHEKINQETVDIISDLDVSDHLNTCFESSEISEKLLTANGNVEIFPPDNNLSTCQPDIDITRLTFKPCQVVLNRCDDQIEIFSSKVTDVNSKNQQISRRSSDSNWSFSLAQNLNSYNFNRIGSDSFHSELSDTDEVISPTKKISPKLKRKRGRAKKELLGLPRSAKLTTHQKVMNKSGIMKEILELKNTMKRAERKIDKLIELHEQIFDSD